MASRRTPHLTGERGSVTAEFALALPAAVVVLLSCCNLLAALTVRISLAESSFTAARAIARGESASTPGSVQLEGPLLCVEQSMVVGVLPVSARACLLDDRPR